MKFFVKLLDKCIDKVLEGIASICSTITFSSLLFLPEKIILACPRVIVFVIAISISAIIFLGIKLYKISKKKIINRIAVDFRGECYCPTCSKYLSIIQHPKHITNNIFHCSKCKENHFPYLENGRVVDASDFYSFQKSNPLTVLTSVAHMQRCKEIFEKASQGQII